MKFKLGDKIICAVSYGSITKGEIFTFIKYKIDDDVFYVKDDKLGIRRFGYQNINKYKLVDIQQEFDFGGDNMKINKEELCKTCYYCKTRYCSDWKYVRPITLDCADYKKEKNILKRFWKYITTR